MEQGNRKVLYLVTFSVSMAFVCSGVMSAWVTVALHKFKHNETSVENGYSESSVIPSLYPVGFTAGSLATRFVADNLGRRATIVGSALPVVLGTVIALNAFKVWLLCIAVVMWNCGTGMLSTVIGYYLAEIADKDVRGTLSLITSFMFKLGMLLMMITGPYLSYEGLNYTMLGLPLFYMLVCWWIPETPYYCLKQGNVEGARKSLMMLRGYKDEKTLDEELAALETDVKKEMVHSSSLIELFTGKQYRMAIIITVGLKLSTMLTGGVLIRQYLSWIIDSTALQMDMAHVMLIYGAISFAVGLMSSILVDRVSRKALLIYSHLSTGFFLAIIGFYFFLQDVIKIDRSILKNIAWVPFLGIIMSNVVSTIGFNSLIYLIPGEIFPMNVKAIAMTSLGVFGCVLAFVLALVYTKVNYYLGACTVFWFFALAGFAGAVFSHFVVIETKGKKLSDIQMELQGKMYDPVAVDDNQVTVGDVEMKEKK